MHIYLNPKSKLLVSVGVLLAVVTQSAPTALAHTSALPTEAARIEQATSIRGWTVVSGNWSIQNKKLIGGPSYENADHSIFAGNPPVQTSGNMRIRLKVSFLNTPSDFDGQFQGVVGRHGGIQFFASNSVGRGASNFTGYTLDWIDYNNYDGRTGYRLIRWDGNGAFTELVNGTPGITQPVTRWDVRIKGDVIKFYGDGQLILQASDATYRSGYFGLWHYINGTKMAFDNVKVDRFFGDNFNSSRHIFWQDSDVEDSTE